MRIKILALAGTVVLVLQAAVAEAHVKWFAPYIVGAPPRSTSLMLSDPWFWTGVALVLVFFLLTRLVEKTNAGEHILRGMDRLTAPLWARLDEFIRVVTGAFFVAIFAVGGVYLTPDLKRIQSLSPGPSLLSRRSFSFRERSRWPRWESSGCGFWRCGTMTFFIS